MSYECRVCSAPIDIPRGWCNRCQIVGIAPCCQDDFYIKPVDKDAIWLLWHDCCMNIYYPPGEVNSPA